MKRPVIAFLAFGSLSYLPASTVAIGQLTISNSFGYQELSFSNFTGIDQGCGVNGSQYNVCNGINIASWSLTLTFTNENPSSNDPGASYDNTLSSPMTFTSGPSDSIGPFNGVSPYTGGASGTWEIPLYFANADEPACPSTCDYQLTQVDFSGVISASDVPLRLGSSATYDSSDPSTYTVFNAQQTFSASWSIPASDYEFADPAFLYDQTDVLVSDQPASIPTPEPGSLVLLGAGMLLLGLKSKLSQ